MTREALAAVEAAKEAGATEVLVSDSHGNGHNLLVEMFPPDVRVIRSWPRRLAMMAGVDASFDAAILIGYYASTDNPQGVRAHTFSSARLTHVAVFPEGWASFRGNDPLQSRPDASPRAGRGMNGARRLYHAGGGSR